MWGLKTEPALEREDLLAAPVAAALREWAPAVRVLAAPIDPDLADTANCAAAYGIPMGASANCVVIAAKRSGQVRMAACVVLATTRADVNGVARRHLEARKASFAPQEDAVAATGMEYGGITPIGLPAEWPVLVDQAVLEAGHVVVGSGLRGSKLVLPGADLGELPGAQPLAGLGVRTD
ncbi:YbaK/EbsC family protein [Streptomonospora nanhaiensis]|uniref:Prolyl-tRNA editing enzyme YbaK/EbsC (Cys-tRNA(Pro) deacylase) n=1 Tax=Streptomonospora nanhaiensis TaxID=1323731 RepID=A0A853BM77_9ACTN|nr:YbaK/EbsC family protein [Streptomonospora nanhaiensis]MBV2365890.1 YbaK/EbsC family protein [Streptomonospora nanhaiensis]MBX9391884.1 YbaK/EbsC family protein [Streptomonospora nanhaiensis]NYI95777.1 prolyl-tRNA editing enzyme YbaK/EbsC (Cys-tRNA(Pro) deacylase) [Streptomonospora nanhaiensis]